MLGNAPSCVCHIHIGSKRTLGCSQCNICVCVRDINNWMIQNRFILHPDKIKFVIACSPHHDKSLQHLSLPLDGTIILASTEVRNFGIVFDCHLSMSNHTSLCRIRRFIDFDTCTIPV